MDGHDEHGSRDATPDGMPAAQARPIRLIKGRGAVSNLQGRFERDQRVEFDDGWGAAGDRGWEYP